MATFWRELLIWLTTCSLCNLSRDVRKNQQCGFWPGLTQTRLYSYWRWLEAWNFVFRKERDCTIRVAKTKTLISEADLRLCFRICRLLVFSWRGSFDFVFFFVILAHISLASFLWDICKQNNLRCDAAKRGVPSGAILFAYMVFIEKWNKNEKLLPKPLKWNGLIQMIRTGKSMRQKRVNFMFTRLNKEF